MHDLVALLSGVRHFRGLPQQAIQAIIEAGSIRRFSAGSIIFMKGAPCAGMFVLLAGRVHVCTIGLNGQQQIMNIVEPVIMFNEVAVLDGGPNPVQAIAVQDSVTWCIDCAHFHQLLQDHPQVGLGLLSVLGQRNRMLLVHYENFAFRSVQARTAALLLELSRGGQQAISRREHPMDEMAERIGTVREPISRALRALRESGSIECTRGAILVKDADELGHQAQS